MSTASLNEGSVNLSDQRLRLGGGSELSLRRSEPLVSPGPCTQAHPGDMNAI